jgi:hypothetical protein
MPENIGSGCALLDYDNDGDQDILLVNGSHVPGHEQGRGKATAALYQNNGRGHFRDVTAGSGLALSLYGMGVAVGDYDGDGWTDIFLTALGPNRLFRNLGGGKFADVTEQAGVAGDARRWSTAAGFLDYNNDGHLDLFVGNYVDWSEALDDELDHDLLGVRDYLAPWNFQGTHSYLYRGNGDGTFTDVSAQAGIQVMNPAANVPKGKALGLVICDLDEDGWQDIIVANDLVQTFLFHNQRDGTFKEIGEAARVGYGHDGKPINGMGIDVGHLHDDDRITIGVANLSGKPTALFLSQGDALAYMDATVPLGDAAETQPYTSWGLFFFDADLDGQLDMFQCNGSILCEECSRLNGLHYLQPSQFFWNCGPAESLRLAALPAEKRSEPLERRLMARGATYGDIDSDGDLDVLISQNAGPALLLRNDQQLGHNWIRLKLVGEAGNREALGARIEVRIGERVLRRRVQPTRGYCSQVELPVTVGLGKLARPDQVRIIWPDGTVQPLQHVEVNRLSVVRKSDADAQPR